ncbi:MULTISPECIES: LysR family transcriptional regulator [Rhodobacterales]|jgi:DNA-binding transcriptional LysR family regulator|uniref:LysR family transcriptional regulator n=1 Tax=Pontivivens nitratireducens TaxID=2758038 RepID=A0A6G7VQS4_9RHOB|nr:MULTISPECIES: LysR family transcriptional regulator [Rhodobacterales]MDF1856785.1 LysR family transcriptional regulator [Pseudooceanicola sp.]QIK42389.1 LysR family transcriptional regulator [Pontibrevibacter nitratireducens]BAH89832.1 LysR family transcriptional regulator [uncultured bacterium]
MDIVDELRAFVATAQTGSFTAAAHQLGVSNRLTSKYVAALEQRLGSRLLQRTTRKVGLTPAGEDLIARAPALLDDLDELLGSVAEGSRGLTGVIRISAPVTFGEVYVTGMLARFARQNPDLTLDLRLDDRYVDLASDGFDLAFRIGRSDMLSLKTLRLGTFSSLLVASPDYVRAHGKPGSPEELADHTCIVDTNRRVPHRWIFVRNGVETNVQIHGRFQVNSARAAMDLAIGGLGIANIPRFALSNAIETGSLVPLLEEFGGDSGPVSAAYLEGRALPRKIRALIDFAAEDIRSTTTL